MRTDATPRSVARNDGWDVLTGAMSDSLSASRDIDGEVDDFDAIFANYAAVTDAPGWYFFWRLANRYADAKVILTVRDANAWFASTQATVLSDATGAPLASAPTPLFSFVHTTFLRSAGSKMHDRSHMIT